MQLCPHYAGAVTGTNTVMINILPPEFKGSLIFAMSYFLLLSLSNEKAEDGGNILLTFTDRKKLERH